MKKITLIFIIYTIVILIITTFFSIQILKGKIKSPPLLGKAVEPITESIGEEQLISDIKKEQEIEKLNYTEFRNSLNFKDIEWQVEKKPNTFRIIALGDSMTEGFGLSNEYTWPKQLEKKLNDFNLSLKFEVFNMGIAGLGTTEELEVLKNFSLRYNPDMIILQYHGTDWQSPELSVKTRKLWEEYLRGEYKLPTEIEKTIKEFNVSESIVSKIIENIVLTEYYRTVNKTEEWNKWVKKSLIEMIKIANEKNIKLIVIAWDIDPYQKDSLTSLLQNYNISTYDFSESLPGNSCPSSLRLPDCHLTPKGYEIVANKTLDIIIKRFE